MSNRIFKVSCQKLWGQHVGLYLENQGVFHNSPGKGEHFSTIQEFSEGKPVTYELLESVDYVSVFNGINAALMSPKQYDLLKYNCEDSVYAVLENKPRSPQRENVGNFFKAVTAVAATFIIAVGVAGLISKSLRS